MSLKAQKLLEEALALPEDARVDLAEALLESVEPDPPEEAADAEWSKEAKRRLSEIQSGAVKPVQWGDAQKVIFDPSDGSKDR